MISFVIALTLTVAGWGFVVYFLLFAGGWRGVVVLASTDMRFKSTQDKIIENIQGSFRQKCAAGSDYAQNNC